MKVSHNVQSKDRNFVPYWSFVHSSVRYGTKYQAVHQGVPFGKVRYGTVYRAVRQGVSSDTPNLGIKSFENI